MTNNDIAGGPPAMGSRRAGGQTGYSPIDDDQSVDA